MITVSLVGHIRTALGRIELELDIEKANVGELLRIVSSMANHSITLDLTNTLVTVNRVEVSALNEGETVVKSGDKVVLIPVSHGG